MGTCLDCTFVLSALRIRSLLLVTISYLTIGVGSSAASDLRRTPFVEAVAGASPAVVNIEGQKTLSRVSGREDLGQRVNGMGTGVVLDERGYILTNYHVVEGVRLIRVTLADGRGVAAKLIAFDEQEDLAVIKITSGAPLPTIKIGSSHDVMLAEPVIAIGNAYGYEHTVTQGIISSLHRDVQVSDTKYYDDLIQISAPINPGNSGGPLLNIDGEMIGLNVAVRAGAENIAFAIPVDKAVRIASRLMSIEKIDRHWHGIEVVHPERPGDSVAVKRVHNGSPAAQMGLESGDTIVRLDGKPIERALDIERALLGRRTGENIEVTFNRAGQTKSAMLQVTTRGRMVATPERKPSTRRAWETLGMELQEIPSSEFRRLNTHYNGGLEVVSVRDGSTAADRGIQTGDVLVGLHASKVNHPWETASDQDIRYIVGLPNLDDLGPLKFFIYRDGETLFGYLQTASNNQLRTIRPVNQ